MGEAARKEPPLILVAEDDAAISRVLELGLARAGYRVVAAQDGAAALETARARKPDLIVLDVMMPKMSGFEVARLLKFDKKYRRIPIVMLTARTQPEDRETGRRTGADLYLNKPFLFEEVLPAIRKLLDQREE